LLLGGELTEREDVLDTLGAELNVGGKVLDALVGIKGRLDESGLNDTSLAVEGSDERVGESGTGYSSADATEMGFRKCDSP
jgi:hypothetical protein